MILLDFILGTVSFMQTGFGVLGNTFLLSIYTFIFFTGHKLRPIDSILVHLSLANFIVLLPKGIPQTMTFWGLNNFLDGVGCNIILYLHRVARSVSLSTTSLLSGLQVITISPSNSRWSELKAHAAKSTALFCFLCWCLYLIENFILLGILNNLKNKHNNTKTWDLGYCSPSVPPLFEVSLFVILFSLPDIVCMGFMTWACGYLVHLLYRHQQQVQHLHSCRLSPRTFPEFKATHTILLLLSTYMSSYFINSILALLLFQMNNHIAWLFPASSFLAASFPTISPFLILSRDAYILRTCQLLLKRKRPQQYFIARTAPGKNGERNVKLLYHNCQEKLVTVSQRVGYE